MADFQNYKNFDKYILRTPLFSLSNYKDLTSKAVISEEDLKAFCSDPVFKEAIFLASPSLHSGIEKWLNDGLIEEKKIDRLRQSVLKYISRISSRCTPFGLFAGCSVGTIKDETNIKLKASAEHARHTQLDMNFLVSLSQKLAEIISIKEQLLFFPNTSIYKVGDKLRYVEYTYINNARRHHIVSVDDSIYLDQILKVASQGKLLKDLANNLVDDDISADEANDFIQELVDNQLLISELEPSVSGKEFFQQIIDLLKKLENVDHILAVLEEVDQRIKSLDRNRDNNIASYMAIRHLLKTLQVDFDEKFVFQTDLKTETDSNTIGYQIIKDLKKGLGFLNKVTPAVQHSNLNRFKEAFYERFEGREMPLSKVLDMETGINYMPDNGSGEINPLVDDLIIKNNNSQIENVTLSVIDRLIHEKLIEAYKNNDYVIKITDKDFKTFDAQTYDFPDTLFFMIEILNTKEGRKIKFNGGGSSSAANLLGRFCHGNSDIHKYVKDIVNVESRINSDKIIAEILHLPESRVGNILKRPSLREFEIPYLSKSTKPRSNQIPINDLMVSVRNDKIFLRSKTHNKEVIPRLTNAHNFSINSLPIYHFLCDLQTENKQDSVYFTFGTFANRYTFLPRVEYLNLILQSATWNLKKEHIDDLVKAKKDDAMLLAETKVFRANLKLPKYVLLMDGDNRLLINLENTTSIKMFLNEVAKRPKFTLREFLFTDNSIVKHHNENFTNEIIVSFFNTKK